MLIRACAALFVVSFLLAGCPEKGAQEAPPPSTVDQVNKDLDAAAAAVEAKTKKVDQEAAK